MPSICAHCKWKAGSGLSDDYRCHHLSVVMMDYVAGRQTGPYCWTRNKNGDCKDFEARKQIDMEKYWRLGCLPEQPQEA